MNINARFDAKYVPEPNSGCWLWVGATTKQGYGSFYVADKQARLAHRVSWFLHRGEMPPPSIKVCHSCDTPACVNPDHLWLGSQRDNAADCIQKGRARRARQVGETNPAAVLRESDVEAILNDRRSYSQIARAYGCSQSSIGMIKTGRNWKHIYLRMKGSEQASYEATRRAEMKL